MASRAHSHKNFRRTLVLRVLLFAATLALCLAFLTSTRLYVIATFLGVGAVLQVFSLIALVETTNRVTERFLTSVAASDFSETFTTGLAGKSFDELNDRLRDLMARFREINLEKEATFRHLRLIVQHLGVGLIAFDDRGRVDLVNETARELLGVVAGGHLSELGRLDPALAERLAELRPGRRELVKLRRDHEVLQLSLRATELRLRERKITLVTLQNIAGELDEKEMEAWQNLIRVFTHEIKNSLTPIASLATTVEELLLPNGEPQGLTAEHGDDVREALRTIRHRSQGLLEFLDAYRDLTHVPQPELATRPVAELIGAAEQLVANRLRQSAIDFQVSIEPETLRLIADPRLIEQVLLNLLLNAIQALEGRPASEIVVTARRDRRGHVVIRVSDNGPGILPEVQEKVFVPFFSTRNDGSGIGLCLSRQILRKHRGELTVESIPEQQTTFTLRF